MFSDRALSYLAASDPDSSRHIARRLQTWDEQAIVHQSQQVRIDGLGFSGIARLELLRILQEHCRQLGVQLQFDPRLTELAPVQDCALSVGADGVNSVVRETYRAQFHPAVEVLSNKYVWYGTPQGFDCLTLTFRENRAGACVAPHYRYSATAGTFIVECDAATWAQAGLAGLAAEESRRSCEEVCRDDLGGHPLRMNKSLGLNGKVVTNRRWSSANVVRIGDALRTVHFSVGSGTRMALEDASSLAQAFAAHQEVGTALREFERGRRPPVEHFLRVAAHSCRWYEHMRATFPLAPLPFASDYLRRSGTISHARVQERSPEFVAAYETSVATARAAHGHTSHAGGHVCERAARPGPRNWRPTIGRQATGQGRPWGT